MRIRRERALDRTDVALDIMGANYLGRNVDVLAKDGRLVVIGLQGGAKAELKLAKQMTRRLRVIGAALRGRSGVWPLVESGAVRPVVEETFPLVATAQDLVSDLTLRRLG